MQSQQLLGAVGSCWELLGAAVGCWELLRVARAAEGAAGSLELLAQWLLGAAGSCWELLGAAGAVPIPWDCN